MTILPGVGQAADEEVVVGYHHCRHVQAFRRCIIVTVYITDVCRIAEDNKTNNNIL